MRKLLLLIPSILSHSLLFAQEIKGSVLNAENFAGISDVLVANKRSGESTYSDSSGIYHINALAGDVLIFYRLGYSTKKENIHIVNGSAAPVTLSASELKLDEVHVQGHTYKMDSVERSIIYGRGLRDARKVIYVRPGIGGFIFYNLPSQLAKRVTGRLKREKHFLKLFEEGEKERFIATRYNIPVVNEVTGLAGDTAGIFLNTYPIDYEFARTASDLELRMWVRDNFKQYRNKGK